MESSLTSAAITRHQASNTVLERCRLNSERLRRVRLREVEQAIQTASARDEVSCPVNTEYWGADDESAAVMLTVLHQLTCAGYTILLDGALLTISWGVESQAFADAFDDAELYGVSAHQEVLSATTPEGALEDVGFDPGEAGQVWAFNRAKVKGDALFESMLEHLGDRYEEDYGDADGWPVWHEDPESVAYRLLRAGFDQFIATQQVWKCEVAGTRLITLPTDTE